MISEGSCDTGVKADGNKYMLKYIKIGNIIEIAIIHFFSIFDTLMSMRNSIKTIFILLYNKLYNEYGPVPSYSAYIFWKWTLMMSVILIDILKYMCGCSVARANSLVHIAIEFKINCDSWRWMYLRTWSFINWSEEHFRKCYMFTFRLIVHVPHVFLCSTTQTLSYEIFVIIWKYFYWHYFCESREGGCTLGFSLHCPILALGLK